MGVLATTSTISKNTLNQGKSKSKIPDYARNYRNEYLFIRGIDKVLEDFILNYLSYCSELFVSSYSDRIKLYIRKFLKAQQLDYLKDTSCFIFKECDVTNIDYLFERMHFFKKMKNLLMDVLKIFQVIEIFMSCFVNFIIK